MNGWLLDTNVVSELRKKRPDSHVKAWSDAQAADSLFLGGVTLAEIRYGIERQPGPLLQGRGNRRFTSSHAASATPSAWAAALEFAVKGGQGALLPDG